MEDAEGVTSFLTDDDGSELLEDSMSCRGTVHTNGEKDLEGVEMADTYAPPDDIHCFPAAFLDTDSSVHLGTGTPPAFHRDADFEVNVLQEDPASNDNTQRLLIDASCSDNLDQPDFSSHRKQQGLHGDLDLTTPLDYEHVHRNSNGLDASRESDVEAEFSSIQSDKAEAEESDVHLQDACEVNVHERVQAESDRPQAEHVDNVHGQSRSHHPRLLSQSERTHDRSKRPGVILLGRGNSFSLGRSEVILLHGNKRSRRKGKAESVGNDGSYHSNSRTAINGDVDRSKLNSINLSNSATIDEGLVGHSLRDHDLAERICSKEDSSVDGSDTVSGKPELSSRPPAISNPKVQSAPGDGSDRFTPRAIRITSAPPGQLSNGLGRKRGGEENGTSPGCHFDSTTELDDELEALWRQAEVVMSQKRSVVEKVLEDYGISNVGGEADAEGRDVDGCLEDFDVDDEEENVWQALQNNFRV